jgi:hypothetical protein
MTTTTTTTTTFETIASELLVTATGGAGAAPQQELPEEAQPRTWGQVGREYAAACVQGAGQAMLFNGRPRSVRDAAITAGIGCATSVGAKALDDATQWAFGSSGQ